MRYQIDHPRFLVRDYRFNDTVRGDHTWKKFDKPWTGWMPDGLLAAIVGEDAGEVFGQLPVVSMGSCFVGEIPSVYIDPDTVMQEAIDHMLGIGCRNILYAGDPFSSPLWQASMHKRLKRAKLVAHSLDYDFGVSPLIDCQVEATMVANPRLLSQLANMPKPFGVIASSDRVGRVICLACERIGLKIPHDCAVLGSHDTSDARSCYPPLSSISNPIDDVGYAAAGLLNRMLDGEKNLPTSIRLPAGRVVVRQSTSRVATTETTIMRAVQLIRDRACDGSSIEQILDELKISRSTLERKFAAALGRTPRDEITMVRMNRAKELLRQTELSLDAIAAQVGYSKSHNFISFFKKHCGTTPSAYRREGKM
ncbi:MAG: substrate-binding domain-containing protein [Tepidisphaeraceae bacterium]